MHRMKLAILAAAGALALSVPAPQAKAGVDFNFGFGVPNYGYQHGRDYRYRHRRGHRARLNCRQARRLVRRHGFRRIRPVDCGGRIYAFRAWRHGDPYRVRVNARRGTIVRARRL